MSGTDPAELLADTLKREGDRESGLQPYRDKYWLPIAQRVTAEGWTSPAEAAALRARIAELEARTPLDPDAIADEFGIKGLGIEDGIATLTTEPTTEQSRALVLAMSLACGRMLDDDEATNYVEFEVSPAGHPGYIVHVRRAHRPSPHDLRKAADARVAELEQQRDRVTDLFEAWAAEENEHLLAGELGIAEGLHVAIEMLRQAVHGLAEPSPQPEQENHV